MHQFPEHMHRITCCFIIPIFMGLLEYSTDWLMIIFGKCSGVSSTSDRVLSSGPFWPFLLASSTLWVLLESPGIFSLALVITLKDFCMIDVRRWMGFFSWVRLWALADFQKSGTDSVDSAGSSLGRVPAGSRCLLVCLRLMREPRRETSPPLPTGVVLSPGTEPVWLAVSASCSQTWSKLSDLVRPVSFFFRELSRGFPKGKIFQD